MNKSSVDTSTGTDANRNMAKDFSNNIIFQAYSTCRVIVTHDTAIRYIQRMVDDLKDDKVIYFPPARPINSSLDELKEQLYILERCERLMSRHKAELEERIKEQGSLFAQLAKSD
jgi:hypothetical protein